MATYENLLYTGTLKAQLLYDPLGRLVQVIGETSGTQKFVYDGNAMIAEYDANNVVQRRYVHGSNAAADDPLAARVVTIPRMVTMLAVRRQHPCRPPPPPRRHTRQHCRSDG